MKKNCLIILQVEIILIKKKIAFNYFSKFPFKWIILKLQVDLAKKTNLAIFNKLRKRWYNKKKSNKSCVSIK